MGHDGIQGLDSHSCLIQQYSDWNKTQKKTSSPTGRKTYWMSAMMLWQLLVKNFKVMWNEHIAHGPWVEKTEMKT